MKTKTKNDCGVRVTQVAAGSWYIVPISKRVYLFGQTRSNVGDSADE